VARASPIQMQKYLSGMDYPASKDEVVKHARGKGADEEVRNRLQKLPDRQYDGPSAVSAEFSKN
jgi:uncharacterized protein DUF2795